MSEFLRDTAGQAVGFTALDTDGEPVTTGLVVHVRLDSGARASGAGVLTHAGGGSWDYAFAQAETDGDRISLDWSGSDVVPGTLTIYTTPRRLRDLHDLSEAQAGLAALDALAAYEAATTADLSAAVLAITGHGDEHWAAGDLTPEALADAVWAATLPVEPDPGSAAAALIAAGNAGDPWAAYLPGNYTGAQAGAVIYQTWVRSAALAIGPIMVTSPVLPGGESVTITRGDSYTQSSPNGPLAWHPENDSDWPDLTGSQITFTARDECDKVILSVSGSVANPAGPGKVIQVDLDPNQTQSVVPGVYKFDLRLILADGSVWTAARGIPLAYGGTGGGFEVLEDQTRW